MEPEETQFESGWYSQELKGYRDESRHQTYHLYSLASLPPLPDQLFRGDYGWLADSPVVRAQWYSDLERFPQRMMWLTQHAKLLGFSLPPEFTRFLSTPLLPSRI